MKLTIRSTKLCHLQTGLIVLLLGVLGMALSLFIPGIISYFHECLFRAWTSLPCPSCGATHAGMELSRLHLMAALRLNPLFTLFYLGMAAAGLNALAGLIFHQNVSLRWTETESRLLRYFILIGILLNWLYLLALRFGLI